MTHSSVRNPVFIDPNIARKKKLIDEAFLRDERFLVLPGVIEISESGICNRKCSFCPRSAPSFLDIKEFIKQSLLEKLFSQLNELNFEGLVIFSGFVEPMLDKKIFEKIF